jgi:hypothetical protein
MRLTQSLSRLLPLLALAGLAACGPKADQAANNSAANETVAGTNEATNATNEVTLGTAPVSGPVAHNFDGLGKIRIGATLREMEREGLAVAGQDEPLDEESTCTYATFKGMPDLAVMMDGERIARIDVGDKQHEGPGGLRVGQSEADALKRLGGKAKVELHPYTGPEGHYLVVHEDGAPRGLIAETDGKQVQSWRIGQWEQVQWIEGCA